MARYLAWFDTDVEVVLDDLGLDDLGLDEEALELAPGLWVLVTPASRSRVYHEVKWSLPDDTPVLVAPLADWPKFRGLSAGSLAWIRRMDDQAAPRGADSGS